MSIIAALCTETFGAVVSDGQLNSPAEFDSSKNVLKRSIIESKEYDKTFTISEDKIIGAIAGILKTKDAEVIDLVRNYISSLEINNPIDTLVEQISDFLKTILNNLTPQEALFEYRVLHLILIGKVSTGKLGVIGISCTPNSTNTEIISKCKYSEPEPPVKIHGLFLERSIAWQIYGDSSAVEKTCLFLKNYSTENYTKKAITSLYYKVLSTARKNASTPHYADQPTINDTKFKRFISLK